MTRTWRVLLGASIFLTTASSALAQTDLQLWGNFTIDWRTSSRLTYALDVEPKALLSPPAKGKPGWWAVDVTPSVDYAPRNWMDLTGELVEAYTAQTNDQNSLEIAPRAGIRFHLLSRDLPSIETRDLAGRERPPRHRLAIRDYVRIELRNFLYTNSAVSSSTWRARNRLEFQYALNRDKMTDDGARYLLADWEWFVPLGGEPAERFASKQRVRAGLGYRLDARWQFEALYMWGKSRETTQESFHTVDHMIDIRIKRVM